MSDPESGLGSERVMSVSSFSNALGDHHPSSYQSENAHVEVRFNPANGSWSEPRLVDDPYIRVHGLSPSLNYGMQVFEGLKAFRTRHGQVVVLDPEKHAARMRHSATFVSMPPIPTTRFVEAVDLAITANIHCVPPVKGNGFLYIRPVMFAVNAQISLAPATDAMFCIYVMAGSSYYGRRALNALVLEDFDRAATNGTGSAKVGGNYAPTIPHSLRASRDGYQITLHLDSKTGTEIEEFSTCAFLGIMQNDSKFTLVATNSKCVIQSVTVEACLAIARHLGWRIERRSIKYRELQSFHEVIAAGTATSLVAVRSISRQSSSETFSYEDALGKPNSGYEILLKGLEALQRGNLEVQGCRNHIVKLPAQNTNTMIERGSL